MRRKFNIHFLVLGVLALCMAWGIALRFTGLNWDEGFHLHPDERFLCIITPPLHWPHSWPEYFNSSVATLNPFNHNTDFFVYGQLPLMITKAIATILGRDDYNGILLVGRFLSALCDAVTMVFVFLIGRRTRSTLTGALAAALFGFTALNIQQSHFWTVDNFAVCFLIAAFYFALRAGKEPRKMGSAFICGVLSGAAAACKISSALLWPIIAVIALQKNTAVAKEDYIISIKCAGIIFTGALITFRVLHPLAFVGQGGVLSCWGLLDVRPNPQFWKALNYQSKISSGEIDVPFNLQWLGRENYLWPLQNLGSWALGWPLLFCFFAALCFIAIRVLRRREISFVVLVAALWCVFAIAFYGAQFSKFTRYYLVITPFVALCAAWFLIEIINAAQNRMTKMVTATIAAGVLLSTAVWALMVTSIYTRPHPRVAASRWIQENIEPGTVVVKETAWDESLPLENAQLWPVRDLNVFAGDDETKRRALLKTLDEAQWIFVSSPRAWKTILRLPARFPLTARYYRALFDGSLGFVLQREFVSFPQLQIFGWIYNDEDVEEALTVYDHPRVLLFVKTDKYSRSNAERILSREFLEAPRRPTTNKS